MRLYSPPMNEPCRVWFCGWAQTSSLQGPQTSSRNCYNQLEVAWGISPLVLVQLKSREVSSWQNNAIILHKQEEHSLQVCAWGRRGVATAPSLPGRLQSEPHQPAPGSMRPVDPARHTQTWSLREYVWRGLPGAAKVSAWCYLFCKYWLSISCLPHTILRYRLMRNSKTPKLSIWRRQWF